MNHGLMTVLLTMRSSRKNGEEFCRMSGIFVLDALLAQCVDVMTPLTGQDDPVSKLTTIVINTYAILMVDKEFLENGDMYHNKGFHNKFLVRTIGNCLAFAKSPELIRTTVACLDCMTVIPELQEEMHNQGVLWHLLPLLFSYDKEQIRSEDNYEYNAFDPQTVHEGNQLTELQLRDAIARESTRCMMRMGGLGGGDLKTSQCKVVGETLVTLLGPHLVGLLRNMTDASEVLDTVNSHVETPFLIWTSDHEKELKKKCELWLEDIAEGEGDPECALSHVYKASESELMIRSVYVRVQIAKTDDEGYLENIKQPEVFLQRMCQWLIDPSKVPGNVMEVTRGIHSPENIACCLRCVEQFLVEKPERVLKVHEFRTIIKLFSFLGPQTFPSVVHQQCLKVLNLAASHPKVVEDVIAESNCLTNLLAMLKADKASILMALEVLEKLTTNAKVLADCVRRGVVIYILNVVASPDKLNEEKAREVLTGMSKSALHGLKVMERMEQFLPGAVVNGLCNGTGEDEFKFTTECKTPELIWNDGMAQQFRAAVSGQLEDLYTAQLEDAAAVPALDEDFQVEYESLYEETYVGGIYLRLFLQNPQYNIRKPEKFVEALLQAHEALAQTEGMAKDLGTICTCVLTVLKVRVMMCDHVANLGYMERLMEPQNLSTSHGRKAMLKYMLLLANSATACEKFARNGEGLKILMGLLENGPKDAKDIMVSSNITHTPVCLLLCAGSKPLTCLSVLLFVLARRM